MARRRFRPGFTLVELLVVVTIIGILVSLLMPAVQSARESARRLQCSNNLYQLGRAATAHEAQYRHFPCSGWGYMWTGDPDMGYGAKQPGGWAYNSLPFMEYGAIHALSKGMSWDAKFQELGKQKASVLPMLHCPTRRKAMGYVAVEPSYNAAQPSVLAKTDYAANGGTWERFLEPGPSDVSCAKVPTYPNCSTQWNGSFREAMRKVAERCNGVSSLLSEIGSAQISDGEANTIWVGEKYLMPDYYYTGNDGADNNSLYQGNDWDTNRWGFDVPRMDTPGFEHMSSRFGSAHHQGVQFVLCDGSVHLVTWDVSLQLFQQLCDRRDGTSVKLPR